MRLRSRRTHGPMRNALLIATSLLAAAAGCPLSAQTSGTWCVDVDRWPCFSGTWYNTSSFSTATGLYTYSLGLSGNWLGLESHHMVRAGVLGFGEYALLSIPDWSDEVIRPEFTWSFDWRPEDSYYSIRRTWTRTDATDELDGHGLALAFYDFSVAVGEEGYVTCGSAGRAPCVAVPEPGTLGLLAVGVLGLVGVGLTGRPA